MTTTLDARAHVVAVKAAIKAQSGATNVYDYGTVPGFDGNSDKAPDNYILITVERRFGAPVRLTTQAGLSGWRITARSVGRSVHNTRLSMFQVATALNENRLPIDGRTTTPIQFESEQPPELDSGRFSGLSVYTYAI